MPLWFLRWILSVTAVVILSLTYVVCILYIVLCKTSDFEVFMRTSDKFAIRNCFPSENTKFKKNQWNSLNHQAHGLKHSPCLYRDLMAIQTLPQMLLNHNIQVQTNYFTCFWKYSKIPNCYISRSLLYDNSSLECQWYNSAMYLK